MNPWLLAQLTICAVGFTLNLISIVVLLRPELRSSSVTPFLVTLACYDMGYLASDLLIWWLNAPRSLMADLIYNMGVFAQCGSVYLTVGITAERFVVIFFPFRARSICTQRRSLLICLILSSLALLSSLPHILYYFPKFSREFFPGWTVAYRGWVRMTIQFLAPFIIIATLNGLIYVKIRQVRTMRARMTQAHAPTSSEGSLTTMLLTVVLVFGICYFSACAETVLLIWQPWVMTPEDIELFIRLYTNISAFVPYQMVLYRVNSAGNFLLYCVFGSTFRQTFVGLCLSLWNRVGGIRGSRVRDSTRSPFQTTEL